MGCCFRAGSCSGVARIPGLGPEATKVPASPLFFCCALMRMHPRTPDLRKFPGFSGFLGCLGLPAKTCLFALSPAPGLAHRFPSHCTGAFEIPRTPEVAGVQTFLGFCFLAESCLGSPRLPWTGILFSRSCQDRRSGTAGVISSWMHARLSRRACLFGSRTDVCWKHMFPICAKCARLCHCDFNRPKEKGKDQDSRRSEASL